MSYYELSVAERATIQIRLSNNLSQRKIAQLLNHSPPPSVAMVHRNRSVHDRYITYEAQPFQGLLLFEALMRWSLET